MLMLALDTSTSQGGVAVLDNEHLLSRVLWTREKSHSELVTPMIESCLKEAGIETQALDALACGHGPGSFTGIRIGVNAVRTLAYSLHKPCFVYDTTEILAAGVTHTDLPVLVLVNAHKNLLYTSSFQFNTATRAWEREIELEARSLEEITSLIQSPHLCVGDGYEEYEGLMPEALKAHLARDTNASDYPLPEALGRLAWKNRDRRKPLDWNQIQALYIRASGAEEKLREERGK